MNRYGYLLSFSVMFSVWFSLNESGLLSWCAPIFVFIFIPILELIIGAKEDKNENLESRSEDLFFDNILYLFFGLHILTTLCFIWVMRDNEMWTITWWGHVFSMGICCGTFGINIAHELGHRTTRKDQFLAKILLLSSLYMHFFIEHNRGHHKNVATPEDPSTARLNEPVQIFWIRSMIQTWNKAWSLEFIRLRRKGRLIFSIKNEMLQFQIIQLTAVFVVFFTLGFKAMISWMLAAFIGAVLLETINYIEHYGLTRKKSNNNYERVEQWHSWNSNHLIGRLLLFELSRHSDHHYKSNKKYQILENSKVAPQMPTGYPGMMVLAQFYPLWILIMNRKVEKALMN